MLQTEKIKRISRILVNNMKIDFSTVIINDGCRATFDKRNDWVRSCVLHEDQSTRLRKQQ